MSEQNKKSNMKDMFLVWGVYDLALPCIALVAVLYVVSAFMG